MALLETLSAELLHQQAELKRDIIKVTLPHLVRCNGNTIIIGISMFLRIWNQDISFYKQVVYSMLTHPAKYQKSMLGYPNSLCIRIYLNWVYYGNLIFYIHKNLLLKYLHAQVNKLNQNLSAHIFKNVCEKYAWRNVQLHEKCMQLLYKMFR